MAAGNDVLNELLEKVIKIRGEFFTLLEKHNPELIPLYIARYEYAAGKHYNDAMRLHNMREILACYSLLKLLEQGERRLEDRQVRHLP